MLRKRFPHYYLVVRGIHWFFQKASKAELWCFRWLYLNKLLKNRPITDDLRRCTLWHSAYCMRIATSHNVWMGYPLSKFNRPRGFANMIRTISNHWTCVWWCSFTTLSSSVSTYNWNSCLKHYSDVIMSAMASQIIGVSIAYSTVCSGTDQRKHQSPVSLAFVRGISHWPVNSLHKEPVTRKIFPFDDVIIRSGVSKPALDYLFYHITVIVI